MTLKTVSKEYVRKIAVGSRILDLAGRLASPSAVILMYHSVRDDPGQLANLIAPGITHASSIFRRQMEIVAQDFVPVTLDDILLFLQGEAGLPRRAIAVTFDDGFADNYEFATPILNHFGIRAAFYATVNLIGTSEAPWYCRLRYAFLTTHKGEWSDEFNRMTWTLKDPASREAALLTAFDHCAPLVSDKQEKAIRDIETALEAKFHAGGQSTMMDWDDLRRLRADGHIVGSHTLTHPNLAHVSDDEHLRRELEESRRRIESELGSEVIHFSYPHPALNPQWSAKTVEMTASIGYKTAVTTTRGAVRAGADPLCLRRIGAPRPEDQFRWKVGRALLG